MLTQICRVVIPAMLLFFFSGAVYIKSARVVPVVPGGRCLGMFESGGLIEWDVEDATTSWKADAGCAIRYRSQNESIGCLHDVAMQRLNASFIVFLGDSRLRQLRDGIILELTGKDMDFQANRNALGDPLFDKKHEGRGFFYENARAQVRNEWEPHLDDGGGSFTRVVENLTRAELKPSLLVMGAGSWLVRDCHRANKTQQTCIQTYKENFKKLLPLLDKLVPTTDMIWLPQCAISERHLNNVNNIGVGFTNSNMQLYNDAIKELLPPYMIYWQSAWDVSVQLNEGLDGLHFSRRAKRYLTQMLLNWACSAPYRRDPEIMRHSQLLDWNARSTEYCCD
ncbi:hypothetical protein BV898_16986 [Hypsibius exemplaris]|uniref:CAS1 domain-containing protein 1 n=1 Tax=Hypsibius exemplaris TaxID=2072580 RepID=A0A9X6RLQ1_HYPEX|nr:hypothetical protein BV898_16986 [Hypsibius exemplaris]